MVYTLTISIVIYMKCYKVGVLLFCHRNVFRHEQPNCCRLVLWYIHDQFELWIVSYAQDERLICFNDLSANTSKGVPKLYVSFVGPISPYHGLYVKLECSVYINGIIPNSYMCNAHRCMNSSGFQFKCIETKFAHTESKSIQNIPSSNCIAVEGL